MIAPHPDYRRLLGRLVAVETAAGVVTGVLVSCSPRSLWLLDDDHDLLVPLADVTEVLAIAA
jgi:hypothetical protein